MKQIPLTNNKGFALVDDEDYDHLMQWKWCLSGNGYAFRGVRKGGCNKTIFMHRQIMGFPEGKEVDHKNHTKLDNQRNNLRPATKSQNAANRKGKIDKFKGVSWFKRTKKWRARIKVNQKCITLGYFSNPEDAANCYNNAAIKHFGEYAVINEG